MCTIFAAIYAILTIGFFDIKFYGVRNIEFRVDIKRFKLDNLSDVLNDWQTLSDNTKINPRKLL